MLETQEELDIVTNETEPTEPDVDETETADEADYLGSATYCPEDDKLRFTADARLSKEDYTKIVKTYGFTWAPKQEIFVAIWTPSREDLLLKWCGSIDDEDYSPEERAADRAERFNDYLGKRLGEATGAADTFASGPNAFGHQSQARAERQARRHDRHRSYAVNQWSKAEYWQHRTAGVISNALHRSSAAVRRSRLLKLEAEERKLTKSQEEHATEWGLWEKVLTLDGADTPIEIKNGEASGTKAAELAYSLAGSGAFGYDYEHPRNPQRVSSIWSLLTCQIDPITPAEAANLYLKRFRRPDDQSGHSYRWSQHLALRIEYEKAMLANEGGMVAEVEMVPGGWICTNNRTGSVFTNVSTGWKQIHAVTRSPATKRVTSVKVMGMVGYRDAKPGLVSINIERLGEDCYRAPTPEELEAFKDSTKERKAKEKASKPKAPPLINPTKKDAEKLQAILNANDKNSGSVIEMTQAQYSERSGGTYSGYKTREVTERLRFYSDHWTGNQRYGREICFKVRTGPGYGVVILTDKPQKPIPWDEVEEAAARQPSKETHASLLAEFMTGRKDHGYEFGNIKDEAEKKRLKQLRLDFGYLGWMDIGCANQCDVTKAGRDILKEIDPKKWNFSC